MSAVLDSAESKLSHWDNTELQKAKYKYFSPRTQLDLFITC